MNRGIITKGIAAAAVAAVIGGGALAWNGISQARQDAQVQQAQVVAQQKAHTAAVQAADVAFVQTTSQDITTQQQIAAQKAAEAAAAAKAAADAAAAAQAAAQQAAAQKAAAQKAAQTVAKKTTTTTTRTATRSATAPAAPTYTGPKVWTGAPNPSGTVMPTVTVDDPNNAQYGQQVPEYDPGSYCAAHTASGFPPVCD